MLRGKNIAIIIIVLAVFVAGFFWLSASGSKNTGEIIVLNIPANTTLFLNNQEERRISRDQEELSLKRLDSGVHSVLMSIPGHWPWLKEVEVIAGEVKTIHPFFVASNASGFFIGEEDPEYDSLIARLNSIVLPDFDNKKISPDESVAVWVDGNTLFAEWLLDEESRPDYFCNEFGCHNVIVPLGVGADIKNVDFYKGRSDVFIIAFGNGVFALEIDSQGNQNFQPIIEGTSPTFIPFDENSIYTLDQGTLRQIAI